jgi:hypothetical protein
MKKLAGLFIAIVVVLLVGCGSDSTQQGFAGEWVSTGGSELLLQIDAPTDGKYPVTFTGGDIERTMTAIRVNDTTYRADGSSDSWVFRMVDDDLMNVTIIPEEGKSATTTFKPKG